MNRTDELQLGSGHDPHRPVAVWPGRELDCRRCKKAVAVWRENFSGKLTAKDGRTLNLIPGWEATQVGQRACVGRF